jgi:serine/threonine protein kinase
MSVGIVELPVFRAADIDYKAGKCLGEGGFGVVFSAKLRGQQDVAVKRLRGVEVTDAQRRSFLEEARTMATLCGDNAYVVRLYGVTEDPLSIVMELLPLGSVYDLIHKNPAGKKLLQPWSRRVKIMVDFCKGLYFIHKKDFIHRDFNVLVGANFEAKLADFGFTRARRDVTSSLAAASLSNGSQQPHSPMWKAPELLRLDRRPVYTKETDIYAAGVTMWELCSLRHFLPGLQLEEFRARVIHGMRDELPGDPALAGLISRCWHAEAAKRPSVEQVLRELEEISAQRPVETPATQLLSTLARAVVTIMPSSASQCFRCSSCGKTAEISLKKEIEALINSESQRRLDDLGDGFDCIFCGAKKTAGLSCYGDPSALQGVIAVLRKFYDGKIMCVASDGRKIIAPAVQR